MIKRILMKNNLSFKQTELEISGGLTVFTGLSGAGKSILFGGILAALALGESGAKFVELELDDALDLEGFGIELEEENIFKMLREKGTKYFINNQAIAKKNLQALTKGFVKHLGARESDEFGHEKFLTLLDALAAEKNPKFKQAREEFTQDFRAWEQKVGALDKILEEEKRVEELKELAAIQIEKIEKIHPKVGEYEELLGLKKRLSKKDKIEEAWARAAAIFECERAVLEALHLSEVDGSFFSECLNELRIIAENQKMEELDFDIEGLLTRIEDLSSLMHRYGSIEGALEFLETKKKELAHYENLSFEKKELEGAVEKLGQKLQKTAAFLSQNRAENLEILEGFLNDYLKKLYMKDLRLDFAQSERLSSWGKDAVRPRISSTDLRHLSSGELNRLRLAFIATECKILNAGRGIIFLDEIDANLSGKEAMSVAKVLEELANFYQIFAISHLPQLSSKAQNHFLVEKKGEESVVKRLDKEERVRELARMVSGENVSGEALQFARTLFED
ncbi:AAA family ATPase [Campylobacter sp.]|uniref:AAA family ATPase n=1 Tax=Campylobacter sp. TaxID=205 RepID=UPI0026DC8B7D|nr:AAA family ATPase [Campylobacter sp.]MDO4674397.1 DNA recombination protein RecN [Campylobacter sp.]